MNPTQFIYNVFFVFLTFITLASCNSNCITDGDGNEYQTIKIGKQTWMAENLKVTHFRSGDAIPNSKTSADWTSNQPSYCVYNNSDRLKNSYGLLYNYATIIDNRKLAPEGWRIPTEEDIIELDLFLKNTKTAIYLKEKGNAHWLASNETGKDSTKFKALPGGYRNDAGQFFMLQSNAYFWTTTGSFELFHHSSRLFQAFADVRRDAVFSKYGFSVRCIKEE